MLRKQREQKFEARFDRYCNLDVFDSPSPPDPNPGIIASAQSSERVGLEAVGLGREQFAYSKERNARLDDLASQVVRQQMGISERTANTADEFANYYRGTYRPLEEEIVRAAREYNVEGTQVNQAVADTRQAFATARGQQGRQIRRLGYSPNQALMQDMNVAEGAALAGNANRARQAAIGQKQAMMLDAAALGRDKPMNSTANFATSLNAGNSAIANQNSTNQAMLSNTDAARGWYGTGAGAIGNAGSLYGMDSNLRMQGFNAQAANNASGMAGIGQLAGQLGGAYITGGMAYGFKDGGEVDGPGGPRGDAIPARLSDGEYVVPAHVVKAKGTEFFDRLLEKYDDQPKEAVPPKSTGYQPRRAEAFAAKGGVVDRRHMMRAMPMREAVPMMRGH